MRIMLKSKIHHIKVTNVAPNYEGSIAIDGGLLSRADILEYEQVHVLDLTNGNRFITYAIEGDKDECSVNGAAARLVNVGDVLIIMAFSILNDGASYELKPRIVVCDG